ncbi:MAG: hypothetical protein NXI31_26125 [bacterium]|nr:hypothetical protein [bacterium]
MHKRITPNPDGVPTDLGQPRLPGSKSHAQRAMLLASCLPGKSRFSGVPVSDDLAILLRTLAARGVRVTGEGSGQWIVEGAAPSPGVDVRIDAGENATVARMSLAMLPLLGCAVTLDGHPRLRRRPMGTVTALLRDAGVACDRDTLPIHADGRGFKAPDLVRVDASSTTQPASGAMLAIALAGGGVVEIARPGATGYLDLTAQILRGFGSTVTREEHPWGLSYDLTPPSGEDRSWVVPPDPSARAFVVTLAALHNLEVPKEFAAPANDAHPDWTIDADIAMLLQPGTGDLMLDGMALRPDSVPALAMLAARREGKTVFRGVANLRTKESDRLAALATGLGTLGIETQVSRDDLTVRGPLSMDSTTVRVPTVADHRIVMALSLLGTLLPGGIEVQNPDAVAKSWPGFWEWLGRCARVE